MNPLAAIGKAYVRWRHSRGYGVHSPFAYDLVDRAISPGNYAYYGYSAIDRTLLSPMTVSYPRERHDARLLLRILVALKTKVLFIYPPDQPVFASAGRGAGCSVVEMSSQTIPDCDNPSDSFLLVRNEFPLKGGCIGWLTHGGALMVVDPTPGARSRITRWNGGGLLLEGTRIIIAVPRQEMVHTRYSMKL